MQYAEKPPGIFEIGAGVKKLEVVSHEVTFFFGDVVQSQGVGFPAACGAAS